MTKPDHQLREHFERQERRVVAKFLKDEVRDAETDDVVLEAQCAAPSGSGRQRVDVEKGDSDMVECSVCNGRIPDKDEVYSFCDCGQYVCDNCQPHGCPPQTFDDAAAEIISQEIKFENSIVCLMRDKASVRQYHAPVCVFCATLHGLMRAMTLVCPPKVGEVSLPSDLESVRQMLLSCGDSISGIEGITVQLLADGRVRLTDHESW